MTNDYLSICFLSDCDEVIEWAENIAGLWNGDDAGSLEDEAHTANLLIEKLHEVKELLAELDIEKPKRESYNMFPDLDKALDKLTIRRTA